MVGVPRSGGCHTCRRRKIRCDEERPNCRKCLHDGKKCDGYERWPTFVNRTPAGLQRRQRLEEAIIPQRTSFETLIPSSYQDVSVGVNLINLGNRAIAPFPPLDSQPPPNSIPNNQYMLSKFIDIFLPKCQADRDGAGASWLMHVCSLSEPSPVLRLALRALAAIVVGDAEKNSELSKEGLRAQGEALGLLGRALASPRAGNSDEVIAASRLLMTFEIFETTSSSVGAWESHQRGLDQMVLRRGPENLASSPFSAALLEDIKRSAMILSMHHNKASVFSHEKWRVKGEIKTLRILEQRNLDLIFDIISLYEEEDKALQADGLDAAKVKSLVKRLDTAITLLHEARQILPRLRPPVSEQASDANGVPFWSVDSAAFFAIGAIVMLDASICVQNMLNRFGSAAIKEDSQHNNKCGTTDDQDENNGEEEKEEYTSPVDNSTRNTAAGHLNIELLAPFIHSHGPVWHDDLAITVVDAAEFMTRPQMGIYGAGRSLFPLRTLLNIFPRDNATYTRAAACYARMIVARNMRHAEDLSKLMGDLSLDETAGSAEGYNARADCRCGDDCGVVNNKSGRSRWCGCPCAKKVPT